MAIDAGRFKPRKKQNNRSEWADWLTDAKPPVDVQQELRQKRVEQANTYVSRGPVEPTAVTPATSVPPSGVSIQINLPEFRVPRFTRTRARIARLWELVRLHLTRKRLIITGVVVLVIAVSWAGFVVNKHLTDKRALQAAVAADENSQSAAQAVDAKPTFTPAVPSNKQQLVAPDNKSSRYDAKKGSYSYYDNIGGKQFTVSEQKTASITDAKAAAVVAAKSLNANTQLKTGWGTAYLLTNNKYNSQTVVASVRELLVFIQSSFTFSNSEWTTYINSLQ